MHFLITAGGTRQYIDPVRFISNASSGKMGYALTRAALGAGHKVTLVTAPTAQRPPKGAILFHVETAAEMFETVKAHFARCDCLIMAAAVSDYAPRREFKNKIKRTRKSLTIRLEPTVDILKWAGGHKQAGQIIVGFAMEDSELQKRAVKKLKQKNLDMVIANSCAAIGADRATVYIKAARSGWTEITDAAKSTIARKIIAEIEKLR